MPAVSILPKKRSWANEQTETIEMDKRAKRICSIAPGLILLERVASFQLRSRKKSVTLTVVYRLRRSPLKRHLQLP